MISCILIHVFPFHRSLNDWIWSSIYSRLITFYYSTMPNHVMQESVFWSFIDLWQKWQKPTIMQIIFYIWIYFTWLPRQSIINNHGISIIFYPEPGMQHCQYGPVVCGIRASVFASSRIPPFEQRIPGKPFGCGRNRWLAFRPAV